MLPVSVLEKAAAEILNYQDSGMSVMEMSHRTPVYEKIIGDAEMLLRKVMEIPDNYKVLFLQGGASTQFAAVPLNFLAKSGKAYTGCNIENSAYSPSLCAERCAVAKAVSEGARDFIAIAVVGPEDSETTPCGVCRQVLYEFCDESLVILCGGTDTHYEELTLGDLLPRGFRL